MNRFLIIIGMCFIGLCLNACGPSASQVKPQKDDTVTPSMVSNQAQMDADNEIVESIPEDNRCPSDLTAPEWLHGVSQEMMTPSYWNGEDRILMDSAEIAKFNDRFYDPLMDLNAVPDKLYLRMMMEQRLSSFQKKFDDNEIMFEDGTKPSPKEYQTALAEFTDQFDEKNVKQYILTEDTTILCAPHDKPYIKTQNGEVRFSRNHCSLGRAQARIEVLFTHSSGMRFARTADMWGWIGPEAKLSPALSEMEQAKEALWFATKAFSKDGVMVSKGAFLSGKGQNVYLADPTGWKIIPANTLDGVISTQRPLTQKTWIETLFLFLDDPYGWGGYGGWRDCSRLILDVARSFGIRLPRNSKEQAVKTTLYFQVEGMSPEDKLKKIDEASQLGIVLLHFPGHIMAYLGRAKNGSPMIFHALSEYIQACDEPSSQNSESLVHVDRVTISDLSLGENTSRTSFLERLTHISVLTSLTRTSEEQSQVPWRVLHDWTPQEETLYSAFIERLFDYPDQPDKSWTNLGDVLRDKDHNILYNSLGLNEEQKIRLEPDCADLPYMLRAYFAWKRGLPMGVRKCSRGTGTDAPKCNQMELMSSYHTKGDEATRFNRYAIHVGAYSVHSGNARTAYMDDKTDFYPVSLDRASLRPGTTYADPYGHLLMIAHYRPDSQDAPGAMVAVDAQPDGTIAQKRFWKGNFLFDLDMKNVGAGFKAFRPMVDGRQLTNDELDLSSGFVPFSAEQSQITKDGFYDRVDAAIHFKPLDIEFLMKELTDSLLESAQRRVQSVQNGDDYIRANGTSKMIMPMGYSVFETIGPWEDFATPSRDMRLLVAMDAVMDLPAQIRRNAKRYGLEREEDINAAVSQAEQTLDDILQHSFIQYQNSVGQPVQLSLKTLMERSKSLEMAYHPSDCNEVRWGAPEGSEEYKTCARRASSAERAKMAQMRVWFEKRVRPPR